MRKTILLITALLMTSISAMAEILSGELNPYIDDLTYTYDTETCHLKIEGTSTVSGIYVLDSYINDIREVELAEGVTGIGYNPFRGCMSLSRVTIPSSVTTIGARAFDYCYFSKDNYINNSKVTGTHGETLCDSETTDGLLITGSTITYCRPWATSVVMPNTVTKVGYGAFRSNQNLKSVKFSDSVTSVEDYAFEGCKNLETLTLSNSLKTIGLMSFSGCLSLKSLTIPNSVTAMDKYAFSGCRGLKELTMTKAIQSNNMGYQPFEKCYVQAANLHVFNGFTTGGYGLRVIDQEQEDGLLIIDRTVVACRPTSTGVTIPSTVNNIGIDAFEKCPGVTTLTLPASIYYIQNKAFEYSSLESIIFEGIPSSVYAKTAFSGFSGIVVAPIAFKTSAVNGGLKAECFYATDATTFASHKGETLLKGIRLNDPYLETYGIKNLEFYLGDTKLPYKKSEDGCYTVTGLPIDRTSNITVKCTSADGKEQSESFDVKTATPQITGTFNSGYSQISICINKVTVENTDESCQVKKVGIEYQGTEYNDFPVTINGLYPEENVQASYVVYFDDERYKSGFSKKTYSLSQTFSFGITSTSMNITPSYTRVDANVTDMKIKVDGKEYTAKNNVVTTISGLDPYKEYNVELTLKAEGHDYSYSKKVKTNDIQMTTLQPKVVTEGNVIVAAKTNVCKDETHVGFEWRRIDWTSEFPSNTAEAVLYDGQIEGFIRNINANYLWKYRPYYKSDAGKYYYGEWMGLDPSNTSYFEATVHTYDQTKVNGNTVEIKGYALRGTDKITSQGFAYWKTASTTRANDGRHEVNVPSNCSMVEASGQIMTATLDGLDYNTKYTFVAYVKTSEGDTFYGEERTFKTGDDPDAIEEVMTDSKAEPEITGYYDLNGRRIKAADAKRGMFIIRYTDGTCRKVMNSKR